MVRILEIVTYINGGGVDSVVYNYLNHMDRRGMEIELIALSTDKEQFREKMFKDIAVKIYYVPHNILKRIKAVGDIIKNGHYDVVHSHCEFLSEWYLAISKYYGVRMRIMHSHIVNSQVTLLRRIYRPIGHVVAKLMSTGYFACGADAAVSMWGRKYFENGCCYIMYNAIEVERFRYNESIRDNMRKKMGWTNKWVIISIARLTAQKNHIFILNLFKAINESNPESILVLVGDGELRHVIEKQISDLGIRDSVELLGNRDDIPAILSASDSFILPSLYEGFPVVSIEAQANGLPIIMSNNITKECGVTDIATFLSLKDSYVEWKKALIRDNYAIDRKSYAKIVSEAGFDINVEAARLRNYYLSDRPINTSLVPGKKS